MCEHRKSYFERTCNSAISLLVNCVTIFASVYMSGRAFKTTVRSTVVLAWRIFRQNAARRFCPIVTGSVGRRRRCRCNKMRQSYISRAVWPRITEFYTNLQTGRSTTTPDMTSLYTSGRKLPRKNRRKCLLMRPQVAFLERGLSEDHQISHGCRGQLAAQNSLSQPQSLFLWHIGLLNSSSSLNNKFNDTKFIVMKTDYRCFESIQ